MNKSEMRRVSTLTATLSELLETQYDGPHISIYQAAGRLPAEAEQARIQLKNHLQNARQQLLNEGVNKDTVGRLLKEADALTDEGGKNGFWNHQEGGLVILINGEGTKRLPVGRSFENLVVISSEFHLKPLMALAANVDAYHLLTLSQNEVKLLRASALGIRQLEVPNLPSSYEDAMNTLGYPPDSFAASAAESNLKVDRKHLKTFFKAIDAAVAEFLKGSERPLLVAGDLAYEPIYREVNSFKHLSKAYLEGNPEHLELDDTHRKATALLKSDFIESQKRTLVHLTKEEPPERISTDLEEILAATGQGRVETLIVPVNTQHWGAYDADDQQVHHADSPSMSSVDLNETAARLGLRNGAEIFFLEANQIPKGADIMAKFRW